jgi:hypothetical protein
VRGVLCKARMTVSREIANPGCETGRRELHWMGYAPCLLDGVPMTLAEKVSEVPELYDKTNKSTARLLKDLGALNEPLKVEEVEDALRHHPSLADRWLERGQDQRLAGGWGIECEHGQYRVQSYASGRHLLEKKKLHAVAEFVVRYVGFIRDVLDRSRPAQRDVTG